MVDTAFLGQHDYDGEATSYQINIAEITGDVAALTTALATLRTATNGLILGGVDKTGFTDLTWDTPVPITDPFAQRETKWQIVVVDANGVKYAANEIGCANLARLENNSPYLVRNGTPVVAGANLTAVNAFIAAFEALALSPAGLALTLWDMYHVGRNY